MSSWYISKLLKYRT